MSFLQKSVETSRTEPNELVVDRALRAQYAHTTLDKRKPVVQQLQALFESITTGSLIQAD